MRITQEPKYCIVDHDGKPLPDARIANRKTLEPIPDDEPLMVFRAKDLNALPTISHYKATVNNPMHAAAVSKRIGDFARFAQDNPERMKEPDTA